MNIGFFIQNSKRGGLDTFLINLINFWPKKEDKIFIFYNKSHKGIIDYKYNIKKKVKYISYDFTLSQDLKTHNKNLLFKIIIKLKRYILLINSIFFIPKLFVKKFSVNKIDRLLIVNGGYQGGEACNSALIAWKKYNPKNLAWYSFHNYANEDKKNIHFVENFIRNLIDRKVNQATKGFISVSKSCIQSLRVRVNLIKTKKIIIYNGKNFNRNTNIKIKRKSKLIKISMLAVFEPRKGFEFIINCMKILKRLNSNIKLFIYGDGTPQEKNNIKLLIQNNNLVDTVFIKNFEKNSKKVFLDSDLIVIPSQKNESFGYVAIESFFYRTPVVACATGGLKEVIRNNYNGFLVNNKNYKVFAKKILLVLKNSKIKKKFIKNGYYSYKKYFTANKMANQYYNIMINGK